MYYFFDVYSSSLLLSINTIQQKPTLIVLHGGFGLADHTLYVDFWSQFSSDTQVIFIDQRGSGRSVYDDQSTWRLDQWSEDIYQFCQLLSIENPIIAGISVGGHVVCDLVRHYSNFPAGLIFCNTEAKFVLKDMVEAYRKLGGDSVAKIAHKRFTEPTEELRQQYLQKCLYPYYAKKPYTASEIERCTQNTKLSFWYEKHELHQFNYLQDLTKICCPTLLLAGEDSPFHPPVATLKMANQIPAQFLNMHLLKDAGSPVYRDQPKFCYDTIKEFLNDVM